MVEHGLFFIIFHLKTRMNYHIFHLGYFRHLEYSRCMFYGPVETTLIFYTKLHIWAKMHYFYTISKNLLILAPLSICKSSKCYFKWYLSNIQHYALSPSLSVAILWLHNPMSLKWTFGPTVQSQSFIALMLPWKY